MKKIFIFITIATVLALLLIRQCGMAPIAPVKEISEVKAVPEMLTPVANAPVANIPEPVAKKSEEPLPEPQLIVVDKESELPTATLVALDTNAAAAGGALGNVSGSMPEDPGPMVYIESGCFMMGSSSPDAFDVESPAHEVCVKGFYMDTFEVDQKRYVGVMAANPSRFHGSSLPVDGVNWIEAREYCRRVGKRLPTEAEWEFGARDSGRSVIWAGTSALDELGLYAWYSTNSGGTAHPVGSLRPNFLGLHDMSGNVREWVADWYSKEFYASGIKDNPAGPETGSDRILRGGSWDDMPRYLYLTYRLHVSGDFKNSRNGFRCAKD